MADEQQPVSTEQTPEQPAKAANSKNMNGALAYVLGPITGILFLVTEKDDDFVRFHAMQSTILFGGIFVIHILLGIFWQLSLMLGPIISLASIICWIVAIYQAYSGKRFKFPVVGDIAEEQLKKNSSNPPKAE